MRFHLMLSRYFWSGLWHHCLSFYFLTMNWTHFAFQQTEWSFINPSNGFQGGNFRQTAALQSYCWCTISLDDSNFWRGIMATRYGSQVRLTSEADNRELSTSSRLTVPVYDYQSIIRDRRLKVIFSRILDSARKDPVLMLKFYWTTFVMVVTASVRACHRVLVSLSEATLAPSRFLPRVAISAWNSYLALAILFRRRRFNADIPLDCRFLEESRECGIEW
jgi:hypothetical protein